MNQKTAILIFANSANAESKKIPQAHALFQCLNQDIVHKAKATQHPYFVFSEHNQQGATFGDKLRNAVDAVFQQGFDYVITVGNDTPQLTVGNLKKAVKNAEENKLTFGPSKDGGFYLMTFDKNTFYQKDISQCRWQSSFLFQDIINLLNRPIELLSYLQDIDTFKDLTAFKNISKNLRKEVISTIASILKTKNNTHHTFDAFFSFTNTSTLYNKGSPLFFI